ncbi:polyhydroxybutyrate depolymerase, partial [Candidatus Bipolaricaulota bacterium]
GTNDPLIPFEGGCVAGDRCERGRVLSTAETVAFWVDVNGASTEAIVKKLPNRSWLDGSTVTVYTFASGSEAAVVYVHIQGGGHNVPGFETISSLVRAVAGSKNRDIDAPTEIWAFFEKNPSREAPVPGL